MRAPIEAADIISIARSGGLIEPRVPDQSVPDLSVRIDSPRRRFVGVGPPSTTLGLIAMGPLDEIFRMEVETNIGSGFESATSEEVGAGWRVELLHDDRLGLRTSALGLQPQVVASVHGCVVCGVNTPGRPIRVALRGPTGALSDTWSVTTPADGGFRVVLSKHGAAGTPRGYWRIHPGDIVEVELEDGDPIVLPVPILGARTDADTEMVTGRTIPGALLQVVVESDVEAAAGGAGVPARSPGRSVVARTSIHAGADGTFAADIGALSGPEGAPLDIEFPMRGRVRSNRPDGHAFEVGWAPIVIRLTMGERSFIQGTGAPGRDVTIDLESSDGRLIAATGQREESAVFNAEAYWFAELRDEVGQPVPILGGDHLTVRVGDDVALLRVPSIDGVVHVSDDLISGRAEPGMLLEARIFGLDGSSADVTADTYDDGSFLVDFGAAGFDIRFNSSVTLSTTVSRHALTRPIDGPGLSIDLVEGTVDGSAQPGLNVEVELVRDGGPIARHEFIAPRGGAFKLAFERLDGERLVPREGDMLVMRMDEGPAPDRAIRLAVPALTIDHDLDADLVWGRLRGRCGRAPAGPATRSHSATIRPCQRPAWTSSRSTSTSTRERA